MNRRTAIKTAAAGILVGVPAFSQAGAPEPTLRSRQRAHLGWRFSRGDPSGAEQVSFDDSAWQSVTLPHDWSIEAPFDEKNPSSFWGGFAVGGTGFYRRTFTPPTLTDRQRLSIEFEGVYRYSQVWFNGQPLGLRPNGFASFEYDLTPHLVPDRPNVLAVRADTRTEPCLRWYAGCGIYRHVWLTVADRCRVAWNGTFLSTPKIADGEAIIQAVTRIVNRHSASASTRVITQIVDGRGRSVGEAESSQTVEAGGEASTTHEIKVPSPDLWSTENPNLYSARSFVMEDGIQVDDYVSSFGIRSARFDKDSGLMLNGRGVKLRGVCLHEDLGCLGAAAHDRAIERRLKILKSLGCNAIRTAHNPPPPYLLDLCDRLGFLVIDEAFDKWTGDWPEGDFGSPGFDDWWQEDLRTMIVRDRNHPSVILWSVGNEAGPPGEAGHDATLESLADFTRRLDPTRPVTCALTPQVDVTLEEFAAAVSRSSAHTNVVSVNYQEQYLDLYRNKVPQAFVSSEAYPFFRGVVEKFDSVNSWWDVATRNFAAGQFVWSGFDYLGESAGWPSKGWPNGLIDTTGFVKARAAFHTTVWRDTPAVFISVISDTIDVDLGLPAWRWPKSAAHWNFAKVTTQPLLVWTVSNCETVELLLNGQSYGVQKVADAPNWTPQWIVWFTAGTMEAVARTAGAVVARSVLKTAGAPAAVAVVPERTRIAANGLEICHLEVSLIDSTGTLVPDRDQLVEFSVSGPARLIGVDNGDLRSAESFRGSSRTTFGGRSLAVIQSTGDTGEITFAAKSGTMPPTVVKVTAG